MVSARLDEDMYSRLLGLAGRNNKNMSDLVRIILKQKIKLITDNRSYTHGSCDAKLSLKQPFCHKCWKRLDWSNFK